VQDGFQGAVQCKIEIERMSVFVTGATGYIGAHLVKKLADDGEKVHVLVRSLSKAKHIQHPNIIPFEGDILNRSSVQCAMKGCNEVYHLAGFAKVWTKDPREFFEINVEATVNILEVARKLNVSKVVFTSTAGVFGPSIDGDINEDYLRHVDFFNEYESSKALTESKIKDFIIEGMDVTIVSPTRVYGPYLFGKPESVTLLIDLYVNRSWRLIPSDGTKVGNYIYIDDVVNGHIMAMKKGRKGQTYILCGENHDFNAFFSMLAEESKIRRMMIRLPIGLQMVFSRFQMLKVLFGGTPLITPKWISKGYYDWCVNSSKAKDELGLNITTLKEGIRRTVEWAREQNQ
jgi:farnesol dehydrogenase